MHGRVFAGKVSLSRKLSLETRSEITVELDYYMRTTINKYLSVWCGDFVVKRTFKHREKREQKLPLLSSNSIRTQFRI